MKSFIFKVLNYIYVVFTKLSSHLHIRPVLTKSEAQTIANEQNRDLIFLLCEELQKEIEKAAKAGLYTARIHGAYPLTVFSLASKIFLNRGFNVQICRNFKQQEKSSDIVYYLKVNWSVGEKRAKH